MAVQNYQLTTIIIMVLAIGIIVTGASLFYVDGGLKYGGSGFNSSTTEKLANYSYNLNLIANQTQDRVLTLETQESVLDRLTLFFSQTYDAIKIGGRSIDVVNSMSQDAISEIPSAGSGFIKFFSSITGLMLFIILVFGILMAVIFKWQT